MMVRLQIMNLDMHKTFMVIFPYLYILTQLGDPFTDEECDALFKECDLDNDGFLVYEDFINIWKNL